MISKTELLKSIFEAIVNKDCQGLGAEVVYLELDKYNDKIEEIEDKRTIFGSYTKYYNNHDLAYLGYNLVENYNEKLENKEKNIKIISYTFC